MYKNSKKQTNKQVNLQVLKLQKLEIMYAEMVPSYATTD